MYLWTLYSVLFEQHNVLVLPYTFTDLCGLLTNNLILYLCPTRWLPRALSAASVDHYCWLTLVPYVMFWPFLSLRTIMRNNVKYWWLTLYVTTSLFNVLCPYSHAIWQNFSKCDHPKTNPQQVQLTIEFLRVSSWKGRYMWW